MSANVVILILGIAALGYAVYFTHTILRHRPGGPGAAAGRAGFEVTTNHRQLVIDEARSAGAQREMSADDASAEADQAGVALDDVSTLRVSRCLWVDDKPAGNVHERRMLEHLRVDIDLARSTNEALQQLVGRSYDVIVTDLTRPISSGGDDPRAGIKLLQLLAGAPAVPPTIVYASEADERIDDARAAGARDAVTTPSALLTSVLAVLADS